jgi:lipopolysaccharide transport system ATP-binding protein
MSEPVIQVDGLGKSFRLGARKAPVRTFRESVAAGLARPLRRLRGEPPPPGGELLWALRDVSFEVQPGEVVGIVGRNGAGKSTLLKILSRISEPTSGQVMLEGRLGSLLEVGTGFHPELTGRENIFLNGALLGMRRTEIRARFDEIVDFSGVERFLDTAVKHYSSGMYMRLAFAVAAHLETEVLVVDEVLAVGDAQFQERCLGKMREVGRSGRTILFVSHNMNAVEQLCQRALLLEGGRLVRDDRSVRSVIKQHLFAGGSGLGSHVWVPPDRALENPWFAPCRISLVDAAGALAPSPLRNDGETWVELEGEVREGDASLRVGYALFNEDGTPLYWSLHTDERPERWPRLSPGRIVLRSRLPPRLLNEGVYRLELISSLHHRQWLSRPGVNAPGLFFTIQGGLSDSPAWNERRPGLLAPVLPWTQRMEAVP